MNKRSFRKPLIIPIVTLSLFGCAATATAEHREFSATPAPNPPVSEIVTVCGQDISFDREDLYERYDRELTGFMYGHGSTLLMLKRANKYFPIMAPILKKNGIPEDILYLACIESYLNPVAVSPAKAAGIWQFMPATGAQYGMEINSEVDERLNIEKATEAACQYLKKAYQKYKDWPTVMASYNAGGGRISSELDKQLVDTSLDLYLNDETSRYFFRVAALGEIFKNPSKYGFKLNADQLYMPVECDIVEVKTSVADWPAWAKKHGITYSQLRAENPWIIDKKLTNKTGKTYKVKVPKQDSMYRSKNDINVYDKRWISD